MCIRDRTKALKQSDLFRVNSDYSINLAKAAMTVPSLKKFSFMSSLASYGTADYHLDSLLYHKTLGYS